MVVELFGGQWGTTELLGRAAKEFAAAKHHLEDVPTVALVGEIYVRLDPFANDFVVDKLEARGIRVRFAPFTEWLEYTAFLAEKRVLDGRLRDDDNPLSIGLTGLVQRAALQSLYDVCAGRSAGRGARPWSRRLPHRCPTCTRSSPVRSRSRSADRSTSFATARAGRRRRSARTSACRARSRRRSSGASPKR